MPHRITRAAAPLAALVLLASCGTGPPAPGTGGAQGAGPGGSAAPRTLTVLAAASLKAAFTEIGGEFEAAHPGVQVELGFAGSSELVTQVTAGAPADVLATADERSMAQVSGAGLVDGEAAAFATNTLQIITPPRNPAGVGGLGDLARPGLALVVCAPQVPCGAATRQVADAAGVRLDPVSEESSVADVLGKVVSGEADAGIVYVTDARAAAGRVHAVPLPEAAQVVNTYPIAVLREAQQRDLAAEFVAAVQGPQGRRVLAAAGFGPPPRP
ncbi:molybdate ABC transporter substrate-binding protein [Kineococcus sp. NUM-3379]